MTALRFATLRRSVRSVRTLLRSVAKRSATCIALLCASVAVAQPLHKPGEAFYHSVDKPEGNYLVTVTFGDADGPSDTTVKASRDG